MNLLYIEITYIVTSLIIGLISGIVAANMSQYDTNTAQYDPCGWLGTFVNLLLGFALGALFWSIALIGFLLYGIFRITFVHSRKQMLLLY